MEEGLLKSSVTLKDRTPFSGSLFKKNPKREGPKGRDPGVSSRDLSPNSGKKFRGGVPTEIKKGKGALFLGEKLRHLSIQGAGGAHPRLRRLSVAEDRCLRRVSGGKGTEGS